MRLRAILASCLLVPFLGAGLPALGDSLQVVHRRAGLPNVMARLRAGQPVRIAYLGASITNGGTASDSEKTSWRALTSSWFRARFPKSRIVEICHNTSGNGSALGAFRVRRDVLAYRPHLVFVEFAVNDLGAPPQRILRAMEGIVRQIRRADPQTDICFVYTLFQSYLKDFDGGKLPYPMRVHEKVAAYYQIPSVNVALVAARQIRAGKLSWEEFSKDVCHPTDKGFRIYFDVLRAFLAREAAGANLRPRNHPLPDPLRADCWERVELRPAGRSPLPKGWAVTETPKCQDMQQFAASNVPGAELKFRFTGSTIGLYFPMCPDSGNFDYRIDDGPWKAFRPLEKWFPPFPTSAYAILADDLPPGRHTLSVRVRQDKHEKSKGRWTRIAYFLVEQQ